VAVVKNEMLASEPIPISYGGLVLGLQGQVSLGCAQATASCLT